MASWTLEHRSETRPCYVFDSHGNKHKGIFHDFYGLQAIVELDDGSVAKVFIEDMVFADSKQRFEEMRWDDD